MTKHTQVRIVGTLMMLATAMGAVHVMSYKITPIRVVVFWFPFGVIADKLVRTYPLTVVAALFQYPLFALAFAAGVRRSSSSIVLAALLCIYLAAVFVAFKISEHL